MTESLGQRPHSRKRRRRRIITMVIASALMISSAGLAVWTATHQVRGSDRGASVSLPSVSVPGLDLGGLPAQGPYDQLRMGRNCQPVALKGSRSAFFTPSLDDASEITDGRQQDVVADLMRDVPDAQNAPVDVPDFFWFSLGETPTQIKERVGAQGARPLDEVLKAASKAAPCKQRFVSVVDDLADPGKSKPLMAAILMDPAVRWRHVTAIARTMAAHPLADGLTVDYEFSLPESEAELAKYYGAVLARSSAATLAAKVDVVARAYTELIRELAAAMRHQGRLIRVGAIARSNSDGMTLDWIKPYLIDYQRIMELKDDAGRWLVDQLLLITVDYHWSDPNGSPKSGPGPIAPNDAVDATLEFVITDCHVSVDRLSAELAAYAYSWPVGPDGLANAPASDLTATQLSELAPRWTRDPVAQSGEVMYRYTDAHGPHVAFDATAGLPSKVGRLRAKYGPGLSLAIWKAGGADPKGAEAIKGALR